MVSEAKFQSKIAGVSGGFGFLLVVALSDYATGYKLTFFIFYLLPILFVQRYAGLNFAFPTAVICSAVWLFVNIAAGEIYTDLMTPIWNTGIRLSVYLLVIILVSNRDQLRLLVNQQTEQLQQQIQERTRLEKELLEIAESEQRRIGHDLHDSLGQHLTATALAGKVLAKKLANKSVVEPAAADQVVTMIESAIELTRNLARTLHPIDLGAQGLEDALQNLAVNLSKAFSISCEFQYFGIVALNDLSVSTHLYRIAQEAASNAIRHGRARKVRIALEGRDGKIQLSVTDDGIGLPPEARAKKGMGLRIMEFRAGMIGATFDIQNLPAGGARAVCLLPPPSVGTGKFCRVKYADQDQNTAR